MKKVVLVTGSESLTGRKLIEKLLERGCRVIAPVVGKETEKNETDTKNLIVLTWNRASIFSTKAIVRESLRLFGRIDAVWIIHRPTRATHSFAESDIGDIEAVLEQELKGSLALLHDFAAPLEASAGFLAMVRPYMVGKSEEPMDALIDGAFRGFAEAYIRVAGPNTWACGMWSNSPDADGFSSAMIELWNQLPRRLRGRWYHFTDKRNFFSGTTFNKNTPHRNS